jgi:hypothetical protein
VRIVFSFVFKMAAKRTVSPITRQQKKKNSEVPSKVRIRKIVPEVPRDEAERAELLEDLQVMGCSGFLEKLWGFKDEEIVRELLDGVSNEFDNSIRALPTRWTEEVWRGFTISEPEVADWQEEKTSM